MKKTLLALLALSVSGLAYAGEGCGGGSCSRDKDKSADSSTDKKPADKPAAPAKS